MMRTLKTNIVNYLFLLILSAFANSVLAQQCQLDNVYLQAMSDGVVTAHGNNEQPVEFEVRVAKNNQTRAAGFQYVCASVIEDKPILFVFDEPGIPSFHMRNVVAPIDIAFIDADGKIESIQKMLPYVVMSTHRPLYSPSREVVAALEVTPGFYQDHNLDEGSIINWELPEEVSSK